MVLVLSTATLLVLASTLQWTTTNTTLSTRNNEYYKTVAIAEAATEKVITRISSDYQLGGEARVFANLDNDRTLVPTAEENPIFGNYRFTNGRGQNSATDVQFLPPSEFRVLTAQYRNLRGYSSAFRVVSNARDVQSKFSITSGVRQDVEVATIPLFQFAIFYNLDLEVNPGPDMTITGPVHCNQNIYLQPQATLTFKSDVTAAGDIKNIKKPGDPSSRTAGTINFQGEHDGGVSTLNLPIGTNNSPAAVRGVVEPPPSGESASSDMGRQRFYNKADMVVTVTDSGTTVKSGLADNFATTVPSSQWSQFLNIGTTFYNKRENKTVQAVELDVAKLVAWNALTSAGDNALRSTISGGDVGIIYIDDQRDSHGNESGVRVINGELLPPKGLTIATPEPLYVKGNFNVKDSAIQPPSTGSLDTTRTKPAALIGDAITVLSPNWNDANASSGLGSRVAKDTTVNAALLSGIVQTGGDQYSGGVENFPRFLEDWGGKTLTYSGSMVVMFESAIARGNWAGTGSSIGIYNPPTRNWAFDQNFKDPSKLPPGTPSIRVLVRSTWAMIRPGTTSVVTY